MTLKLYFPGNQNIEHVDSLHSHWWMSFLDHLSYQIKALYPKRSRPEQYIYVFLYMLPYTSMCIIYMLCIGLSDICQFEIIAVGIIFDWYFVHVVLSLFCVQIPPHMESVYWFHIVFPNHIIFPYLCKANFLLSGLLSLICSLCSLQWTMLCTWCSHLCWAGYIKAEIFGNRSDLKELLKDFTTLFCRGMMCC